MPTSFETVYANTTSPDERIRLQNDLEIPVLARHQMLGEVKERLTQAGANGVLMSGSGSTVFAIFETEAARENARRELSRNGWWCAAARTLGREEYKSVYRQVGALS